MDMNDLKALGITEAEITERVVERIVEQLMVRHLQGDDDRDYERAPAFQEKMQKHVADRIDSAVQAMADKVLVPNVETFIANFKMKETSSWGEAKGKEWTFTEWLVERADRWMNEPVNGQGKTKDQDSYSWRASTTRLGHAVYEHLDYRIKSAMTEALSDMNKKIGHAVAKTVEIQLADVLSALKKSGK